MWPLFFFCSKLGKGSSSEAGSFRGTRLEPFADITATPKHITQNADWLYDKLTGFGIVNESEVLAVVFHNADGDAWIDVLEMKSLIVRDALSNSSSNSHAAANAQPADWLLYKFLVIVGLDDI